MLPYDKLRMRLQSLRRGVFAKRTLFYPIFLPSPNVIVWKACKIQIFKNLHAYLKWIILEKHSNYSKFYFCMLISRFHHSKIIQKQWKWNIWLLKSRTFLRRKHSNFRKHEMWMNFHLFQIIFCMHFEKKPKFACSQRVHITISAFKTWKIYYLHACLCTDQWTVILINIRKKFSSFSCWHFQIQMLIYHS